MIASYETETGERFYTTPDGEFPSVTTILDATADNAWLAHWRRKVGEAEANRVRDEARARGTALHGALERYLLGGPAGEGPWWDSVQHVLRKVEDVEALEQPLYHRSGFAGTVDLVATIDGVRTCLDWKTSRKRKQQSRCVDYGLQATAYAHAAAELLERELVEQVLIVVALETAPAQVFRLDAAGMGLAWYSFRRRLDAYTSGQKRHLVAL